MIANNSFLLRALLPLLAGEMLLERQLDLLGVASDWLTQWDECLLEHSFHFSSDFLSVIDRVVEFAPRNGIGIAAATDAHQSNRAGIFFLDSLLGAAGPIRSEMLLERRLDLLGVASDWLTQWDECLLEHSFHFSSDFLSVIDRVVEFAPRNGIGIAAATDAHQSNRAGIFFLDSLLGAAGPI